MLHSWPRRRSLQPVRVLETTHPRPVSRRRADVGRAGWLAAALLSSPLAAQPADDEQIIVTAPGDVVDGDATLGASALDIRGSGRPDLFRALTRSVPGLSLQDAQNNPYQPNLVYRGFTISPLQGQAQGLAVYVDGGRFNQPFGDTVQFDLLPETAIESIRILDASPVYGLNALGGALVVATKTGRTAPGVFVSGATGRYGELEALGEAGFVSDRFSAYAAVQAAEEDGWRRFSPSNLVNGFLDLGFDDERWGVHAKLIAADSDLTGNGTAPVELLAADRRAVFTHPDNTRNTYVRGSLHPYFEFSPTTRLEASLYAQDFRQRTLNGDAADIEECEDDPDLEELLCLETADEEESTPLVDTNGDTVADTLGGEGYGVLNRGRTRSRAWGALVQLVDRRPLFGGDNLLVLGASYDRSRTRFDSSTELGALNDERSVDGLGPIIAQPDGVITPVSLTARTRYTGLFASDRVPLGPDLTAELGLRYNHARIILDDRIGTALDGSHRFERVNPGAELEWRPTRALTLRAGYSESNRAPTAAELACAYENAPCSLTNFFVADPPLAQVVARTIDLGAEARVAGVALTLAAYRATNFDDIQFLASDTRGRAFFQNVGRTRRQGVEANAAYTRGPWRVVSGYALTDASFRSELALESPDNPSADDDGLIAVQRGDRLPGVPRHRALLSIDYTADAFTLGADLQAASGQYLFGDEANFEPRTGGYAVVNARGSLKLVGPLSLFAEVRNLFDRDYETFGAFGAADEIELEEAPGATNPRSLGPAAPRRWTAGLSARF